MEVKPWFDESLALLEAEEYEQFDDAYDKVPCAAPPRFFGRVEIGG
ncbi:hypothetical protein ACIQWN_36440 [Streptomyces vinaceus]